MGEERVLVFGQTVQTALERVVLGQAFIHPEPIGAGGGGEPVPGQPPFAAGGKQAVEGQEAEPLFPIGAFAARAQARGEEGVERKLAPELIARPAGAPGAGTGELPLIQPDVHGGGAETGGVRSAGPSAPWRDGPSCSSKTATAFCQAACWESLLTPR